MTLVKGFLTKRGVAVEPFNIISGIILWITFSYILYGLFYVLRESFRIMTFGIGHEILLVLNENEHFLYNLFYAAIAVSIGYMFSLNFVLSHYSSSTSGRTKFQIRQTLNEEGFFKWSFLFWFGKTTSLLGICYLMFPLQFDINFIKEFPLLLVLMPIVVFLSTWPRLNRVLGPSSVRWLGGSMAIFLGLSFLFAKKDFLAVGRINGSLLKNSFEYSYDLEVPKSQSQQRIQRRSLVSNIYMVIDSNNSLKPLVFMEHPEHPIDIKDIKESMIWEIDRLSIPEREFLTALIHIDKDIPVQFVTEIKHMLRKVGFGKIHYSTGMKHSKYPSNHPAFKYSGISQSLHPRYYPQFEAFLDSAEKLDLSKYSIRLPESEMYRLDDLKHVNRIELTVGNQTILLNNQPISIKELESVVYKFIQKYSPNYTIILNTDDDISFGRYLTFLDLVYFQIDKLRNKMSMELFGRPFDDLFLLQEISSISSKLPRNVIEWTEEEKRLLELIKHDQKVKMGE